MFPVSTVEHWTYNTSPHTVGVESVILAREKIIAIEDAGAISGGTMFDILRLIIYGLVSGRQKVVSIV